MAAVLGDREAVIAREITKKFEEFREGSLCELAQSAAATPVKGEIVLIVHPPSERRADPEALDEFLRNALEEMSPSRAAAAAAATLGVRRRDAYSRALDLSKARAEK